MSTHIEATFEIASWEETPFEDADELTNAGGTGKFRADPAGSITLDLDGV